MFNWRVYKSTDEHGESGTQHADHGGSQPVAQRKHRVDDSQAGVAAATERGVICMYAVQHRLLQQNTVYQH